MGERVFGDLPDLILRRMVVSPERFHPPTASQG
jgi:hypothetical protein